MSERYKNCPFCDSADLVSVFFNTEDPQYYAVVCNNCEAVGPKGAIMTNEDRAKWNERAGELKPDERIAVIYQCKQALAYDGTVFTRAGQEALLCNDYEGWVDGTGFTLTSGSKALPKDTKLFASVNEADAFMKRYKGHPWYYTPNGEYRTIKVKPSFKREMSGLEMVD